MRTTWRIRRTLELSLSAAIASSAILGCEDSSAQNLGPNDGGGNLSDSGGSFPDAGSGNLPDASPTATASCTERYKEESSCPPSSGKTFYVSSTGGNNANDGLSEAKPLASIAAVNALDLKPGDRVLFHCGDTWSGEELVISKSGAHCANIVFSSYPENQACSVPPTIRGSLPISGWTMDAPNVWVADLGAGANAGKFVKGITQVFAGDSRLPIGRWPNLDDASFSGGWAHMEAGGGTTIQDSHLPSNDWSGAVLRVKTIRWLLLSRRVTGSSGNSITLNDPINCWGQCGDPDGAGPGYGWGYHLVNHRATLDQPGEWFFDKTKNRIYVVAPSAPTNLEASPIAADVEKPEDLRSRGGINLGKDMNDPVSWVVVENLRVMNHYLAGIVAPTNFHASDNHDLVIRCNTITNPEEIGISLASWVYECSGCKDDWYGGKNLVVSNNVIEGPNRHGILTRAVDTVFQDNVIRNVGQIANLGEKGLGCGFEGENCTEHGDGVLMSSPSNVVFRRNRIEATGYCGVDIFGSNVVLEENVIDRACSTKGDCGAVRTFGGDSLAGTLTHDITLRRNIIRDVVGPTFGDNSEFSELFGFGLYVDNNSRDVLSDGNVIARTTAAGILYQNSTGSISNNTVFDTKNKGREAVSLAGEATVSGFTNNSIVLLSPDVVAIRAAVGKLTGSNNNIFFTPYDPNTISVGEDMTLTQWQAKSGQDTNSVTAWYTLAAGSPSNIELFINDTGSPMNQPLVGSYFDLRKQSVSAPVSIPAFSAVALVKSQ